MRKNKDGEEVVCELEVADVNAGKLCNRTIGIENNKQQPPYLSDFSYAKQSGRNPVGLSNCQAGGERKLSMFERNLELH